MREREREGERDGWRDRDPSFSASTDPFRARYHPSSFVSSVLDMCVCVFMCFPSFTVISVFFAVSLPPPSVPLPSAPADRVARENAAEPEKDIQH